MPIFEEPPPNPVGKPPGRPNPWKEAVLDAKNYPGKWIRITKEPAKSSTLLGVKRGLTRSVYTGDNKGRYHWLDEDDDFDAEIRRVEAGVELFHLYVRYNGKGKRNLKRRGMR